MADDWLGLKRERLIEQSRIRLYFTPHQPIANPDLFVGRQEHIKKIIGALGTPGEHAILYGERGVGKSSLAKVSATLFAKHLKSWLQITYRCDSQASFESLAKYFLEQAGITTAPEVVTEEKTQSGGAKIKIPVAEAKLGSESKTLRSRSYGPPELTPSAVSRALAAVQGVGVVDEFDALTSRTDRWRVGELVKHLSDEHSSFKLLLVGIADNCEELLAGHASAARVIREVRLGRMPERDLRRILEDGSRRTRLHFSDGLLNSIVALSAGYPYFTHLLALKCAEIAVVHGTHKADEDDLPDAAKAAAEGAEERLRRAYADAVRSQASTFYLNLVDAAAALPEPEFSAAALREALTRQLGSAVTQAQIRNHFRRLLGEDAEGVFRRVAKGHYKFSDPRMKSFVLIQQRARSALR